MSATNEEASRLPTGIEALPHSLELIERECPPRVCLRYIDQRQLPERLVMAETGDWHDIVDAIQSLALRGAPALGVAGAAAVVLAAWNSSSARSVPDLLAQLGPIAETIASARPTAVNLSWGVGQMMDVARGFVEESEPFHPAMPEALRRALLDRAREMEHQDMAANRLIGAHGAGLLLPDSRVMTYCNAGSLATVFYGTALGVIYSAFDQGKVQQVYVCETRPVGQGARLTAWELAQAGVPATLICDNMAASLMAQGKVDAVIVGADRICANGDVVNKIGTYGLAVLAKHHGLPFYVAAPHSSFDLSLEHGGQVTIEERNAAEVATSVPEGVAVYNPAFDRTPADLLTAFITDQGIMHPGKECLARAFRT